MTFWNVAAAVAIVTVHSDKPPNPHTAIREMEEGSLKDGLIEIVELAARAHARHMAVRSPFLSVALLALWPVLWATGWIRAVRNRAVALPQTLVFGHDRTHRPGAASSAV